MGQLSLNLSCDPLRPRSGVRPARGLVAPLQGLQIEYQRRQYRPVLHPFGRNKPFLYQPLCRPVERIASLRLLILILRQLLLIHAKHNPAA